jgi:hypothetical protein
VVGAVIEHKLAAMLAAALDCDKLHSLVPRTRSSVIEVSHGFILVLLGDGCDGWTCDHQLDAGLAQRSVCRCEIEFDESLGASGNHGWGRKVTCPTR